MVSKIALTLIIFKCSFISLVYHKMPHFASLNAFFIVFVRERRVRELMMQIWMRGWG